MTANELNFIIRFSNTCQITYKPINLILKCNQKQRQIRIPTFFFPDPHKAVLRIRDVLSRIPNFFYPGSGGENAPDPGSRIPDPTVHKNRDEK
jgi:hypothetical protein